MARDHKIKIKHIDEETTKSYPSKVPLTPEAWDQLKALRKIFNEKGISFHMWKDSAHVEVTPKSLTYSKTSGHFKNKLAENTMLPCDLTTFVNDSIGKIYKRATEKNTIILYDYNEDGFFEPRSIGVVKNGKLHFGL